MHRHLSSNAIVFTKAHIEISFKDLYIYCYEKFNAFAVRLALDRDLWWSFQASSLEKGYVLLCRKAASHFLMPFSYSYQFPGEAWSSWELKVIVMYWLECQTRMRPTFNLS